MKQLRREYVTSPTPGVGHIVYKLVPHALNNVIEIRNFAINSRILGTHVITREHANTDYMDVWICSGNCLHQFEVVPSELFRSRVDYIIVTSYQSSMADCSVDYIWYYIPDVCNGFTTSRNCEYQLVVHTGVYTLGL